MAGQARVIAATTLGAMLLLAGPVGAQTSLEDQKKLADLALVQAQTSAAVQAQTVTALAAAKQPTEGKATVTDGAATAEGLALSDFAVRQAALQLADQTVSALQSDRPVLLIIGAAPPTTAQWFEYRYKKQVIASDLALAVKQWGRVKDLGAAKEKEEGATSHTLSGTLGFVPGFGAAAAVVSTGVSLVKTDYTIAGSKLSPSELETRAIIAGALRQKGVAVDQSTLQIADDPSAIVTDLKGLREGDYGAAVTAYYGGYTDRLIEAGGDPKKMNDTVLTAGKSLLAAITNFEAFERSLFAPTNGVLPASEILRQKAVAESRANQPLLYVTSIRTNMTTVTKKNLLSGIRSKPASLRAAAQIDYGVVRAGEKPDFSSAFFTTPEVKFDEASRYLGYGFVTGGPPAPVKVKNAASTPPLNLVAAAAIQTKSAP